MRLFIGIAPDEAARAAIAARHALVQAHLASGAQVFRWTRPENLHVTLHFLGEVPEERLDEVVRVLAPPIDVPAFAAASGRVGTFPERGAPRVIWLAVERGADAISAVHAALADRLRALRLPVETRPFTPHFTLARARDRHPPRDVRRVLADLPLVPAAWTVASATLYRSDLSGASPRYVPLLEIALAGPRRML